MPDDAPEQLRLTLAVEAWKMTVQVQQHFNDIEMRVRALALTVMTAVLGVAGVTLKNGDEFEVLGQTAKLATTLIVVAIIVLFMFFMVDQMWYHRLLIGATRHAEAIEEELKGRVPGIALAQRISRESPYPIPLGRRNKEGQRREISIHSNCKALLFYGGLATALLVLAIASAKVTTTPPADESQSWKAQTVVVSR